MKTASTYERKITNAVMIIFMYLILGVYSCIAQSFQRITHNGIEGSFGLHGIGPSATAGENGVDVLTRGVSIGFVTGNNLIKARIKPIGIYKSTSVVSRSFDILQSEALLNVYPLEFIRTRKQVLDIYITTGVSFNNLTYKDRHVFVQNDAQVEFKKLDRVIMVNQVSGIGFEYHLPLKFAHVFAEALFANPIYTSTQNAEFDAIAGPLGTSINFGIRLGTRRNVANSKKYPG
jgi:hypothetical protein